MSVAAGSRSRAWGRWHSAGLLLAAAGVANTLAAAAPAPAAEDGLRYDIPAQPLNAALAAFGRVSGIDIFYEAGLASGHRSAPLEGRYTGATALRLLLNGTGLDARFTGPKAAIIFVSARPPPDAHLAAAPSLRLDMAQVRAPVLIGRPRVSFDGYARSVEHELRTLLAGDARVKAQTFRQVVAIRVDRAGRIESVTPQPGQARGEAALCARLCGRLLSRPPPAGVPQPLRFEISSAPTAPGTPPPAARPR